MRIYNDGVPGHAWQYQVLQGWRGYFYFSSLLVLEDKENVGCAYFSYFIMIQI